jgi:hypothetical protein
VVEQLPEHELAYGSEPAWERGEGEAVVEQQPPRASGCEAATSSRGRRLGVVEALLPGKHQGPYLARQMSKWCMEGGLLSSWRAVSNVASAPATTNGAGMAPAVRWGRLSTMTVVAPE